MWGEDGGFKQALVLAAIEQRRLSSGDKMEGRGKAASAAGCEGEEVRQARVMVMVMVLMRARESVTFAFLGMVCATVRTVWFW